MRSLTVILLMAAVALSASNEVAEVARWRAEPGEAASARIAKFLSHRDAAVREAAIKALGGRMDGTALKALRGALKTFAKDANLLPVVVVSLGESRDADSAKAVADLLKKAVGRDMRLARASIDTLGRMRANDSVACLVGLLAPAIDPRGASHPELADELFQSLREVTDLPFRNPATFVTWWRRAKGRFRGLGPEPPERGDLYRTDGWRFTISRPDAGRWSFKSVDGAVIRLVWVGPKGEAVFAWVDVMAHAAAEGGPKTAAEEALRRRKWMEGALTNPKDSRFAFRTKLGTVAAVGNEATGILKGGHVVRWRTASVERNGLVYTVSAHVESGAAKNVTKEVDEILATFRLLDR